MLKIRPTGIILCLLLILLSGISFSGCDKTTSTSYDKDQLEQIMYNIHLAYEQNDIDGIMANFHSSFLHDGQTQWQIREVWLNRMGEFPLIEFQDVSIEVDNDNAVVSFTMVLEKPGQTVTTIEPEANGDLSYFFYDNEKWQVYGNRHR